jgi:hypothetical protein
MWPCALKCGAKTCHMHGKQTEWETVPRVRYSLIRDTSTLISVSLLT